jgi:hypothetical protein
MGSYTLRRGVSRDRPGCFNLWSSVHSPRGLRGEIPKRGVNHHPVKTLHLLPPLGTHQTHRLPSRTRGRRLDDGLPPFTYSEANSPLRQDRGHYRQYPHRQLFHIRQYSIFSPVSRFSPACWSPRGGGDGPSPSDNG